MQRHRDRFAALSASGTSLVFGRLDLADAAEPYYIGRVGLRDEHREPLLIDWRAPVAAPFYRATATDPGHVRRRRTLRTAGRTVSALSDDVLDPTGVEDLGSVYGDGALMAALTAERGPRMADIVATIQAAQDEIIRTDPRRSVLLTGGPGTGKSVVALHRAAYLMYERSEYLARAGVLVVGPSELFADYISTVLPGLGETAVAMRSLYTLTGAERAHHLDPVEAGAVKGSSVMAQVIARYLADSYPTPTAALRYTVNDTRVSLPIEVLVETRRRVLHEVGHDYNRAHGRLTSAVALLLARSAGQVDGTTTSRAEVRDLVSGMHEDTRWLEFLSGTLLPVRDPRVAFAALRADPARLAAAAGQLLDATQVATLISGLVDTDELTVADLPLLDEVRFRLGDPPAATYFDPHASEDYAELTTHTDRLDQSRGRGDGAAREDGFGHIVVDEAQDLSPMQWRVLRRRGTSATWTVVGDWAQATLTDPRASHAALAELTGRTWARFTLQINYRTPAQIASVAHRLCELPAVSTYARDGSPPELFTASDGSWATALSWLAGQPGSKAVVVPPGEVDDARASIDAAGWSGKVSVLDAIEVKGLEFDAVIVCAPERYDIRADRDRSMLLIAATRATQQLAFLTFDAQWPQRWQTAVRGSAAR